LFFWRAQEFCLLMLGFFVPGKTRPPKGGPGFVFAWQGGRQQCGFALQVFGLWDGAHEYLSGRCGLGVWGGLALAARWARIGGVFALNGCLGQGVSPWGTGAGGGRRLFFFLGCRFRGFYFINFGRGRVNPFWAARPHPPPSGRAPIWATSFGPRDWFFLVWGERRPGIRGGGAVSNRTAAKGERGAGGKNRG